MTSEPYASADRVFWIVDNGSFHHAWRSVMRLEQARPTPTCRATGLTAAVRLGYSFTCSVTSRTARSPQLVIDRFGINCILPTQRMPHQASGVSTTEPSQLVGFFEV
jgi:hypothetical protein